MIAIFNLTILTILNDINFEVKHTTRKFYELVSLEVLPGMPLNISIRIKMIS